MSIRRVEINDFLVFKGDFAVDFCKGVNVIIGGNGTGKTTLLKAMYSYFKGEKQLIQLFDNPIPIITGIQNTMQLISDFTGVARFVYIPEKDILEHAKGLLTFIEQKQTGFNHVYRDVLIAAQDIPTQEQSETQKSIGQKIADIIGGEIQWDKSDGSFYTIRTNGTRIPFANEASGFKKFGFLGLLVASGQISPGVTLFWDEPENSLNPELVPILVDILLELSRNGVQIFISTHSEILASYFAVNRQNGDNVMFTSLYKDKDSNQIKANTSSRFDLLEPNNLTAEPVKLYEKEIEKGLGGNG